MRSRRVVVSDPGSDDLASPVEIKRARPGVVEGVETPPGSLPQGCGLLGSTLASIALSRNAQAYCSNPRPRSQSVISIGIAANSRPSRYSMAVCGIDQCAASNALKLVIPESNDPTMAAVASTPRGKLTLINEARKIAAIGRAMTK